MSELLTCERCHCLVHETRAKSNVQILISIGGRLTHKTDRMPLCQGCFDKVTGVTYALSPANCGASEPIENKGSSQS